MFLILGIVLLTLHLTGAAALASNSGAWQTAASMPTAREMLGTAVGPDGRIYAIGGLNVNIGALATVEAYTPGTNSWTTVAPMPTARYALATVAGPDGRIYAIGGEAFGSALNTVEAYTPSSNTWTTVAPMPTARAWLAAAVGSDGRIYAIGGEDNSGNYLKTVEAYTPSTNTWTTVASMTYAREFLAAVGGPDGHIYAIGGFNSSSELSIVEAYTPGTNSWATVASMPTRREGPAAAVGPDGRIYAMGGSNQTGRIATVEAYTPTTNTWVTVASMPTARDSLGAVAGPDARMYAIGGESNTNDLGTVEAYTLSTDTWATDASLATQREGPAAATGSDGRIYAMGGYSATYGYNGSGFLNSVEAYTPSTNTWAPVASMPTPRSYLAAVEGSDGRVYAIGGAYTTSFLNTVEAYTPSSNTWATIPSMPTPREGLAAVEGADGRIYAIGGYNSSGALGTMEAYSPITNSWTTLPSMPTPRYHLAAVAGPDGLIYAIGGYNSSSGELNTVEAYSPTTNSWTSVASMPTARDGLAAATAPDGRIYAMGGTNSSADLNTVEAYTPSTNTWATVTSMPTAREELAATTGPDGTIYAIGGMNPSAILPTAEGYTPSTWAPAASTTSVTANHNPSAAGGAVTFTATVAAGSGGTVPTGAVPTGAVQFKIDGSNVGSPVTLASDGSGHQVATYTTSSLSGGSHSVEADYPGDGTFAASSGTLPGGEGIGTNPSGAGKANPSSVKAGGTTLLTVAVTPGQFPTSTGTTVSANLTSIGGSSTQPLYDDGTHGDVTGGDGTYSASVTVAPTTATAPASIPYSISDSQGRSATGSISLSVTSSTTPTTTATLAGTTVTGFGGQNACGSYFGPMKITLTASDTGGPGIASTHYSLTGANPPTTTYTAPFKDASLGSQTVTYAGTDTSGNTESTKSVTFTTVQARSAAIVTTVGTTVTPMANTFAPSASVNGWWDSNSSSTFSIGTVNSGCHVQGSVVVPAMVGGSHTLTLSDGTKSITIPVTIQSKMVTAFSGQPTHAVSATGSGFGPSESVNFTISGNGVNQALTTVSPVTTDTTGSFSGASVTVPTIPAGTYTITATGATSGDHATHAFTIKPIEFLHVVTGSNGRGVQVSGAGYAAGHTVTIYGGCTSASTCASSGTKLASGITVNSDGTVPSTPVAVPSSVAGGTNYGIVTVDTATSAYAYNVVHVS